MENNLLRKSKGLIIILLISSLISIFIIVKNQKNVIQIISSNLEKPLKLSIIIEDIKVIRVIDGDTVLILINGKKEKARLIGVDTPEKKDCYYEQATLYLRKMVENKFVKIAFDPSQSKRDKYHRFLIYLWKDSIFINQEIILNGMGKEYTFNSSYFYQNTFIKFEYIAKQKRIGLWGKCE